MYLVAGIKYQEFGDKNLEAREIGEQGRIIITVRELQIPEIIGRDCKSRPARKFRPAELISNLDFLGELNSILGLYPPIFYSIRSS